MNRKRTSRGLKTILKHAMGIIQCHRKGIHVEGGKGYILDDMFMLPTVKT